MEPTECESTILSYLLQSSQPFVLHHKWHSLPSLKGVGPLADLSRFQWVKCQIDNFCTLRSDKAIRFALKKLPKTLEEVYLRILQRVERDYENDIPRVQKLLRWLVKGSRSLSLDELAECTGIGLENRGLFYDHLDIITRPRDILEMCSSLITISDDGPYIFLAHYTVKEFLISKKTFAILKTLYAGGDNVEAELAKTCLTYLNFEDFSMGILSSRSDLDRMLHQYKFLAYAAQSWAQHVRIWGIGLQVATYKSNVKAINWLLEHGADLHTKGQGRYRDPVQHAAISHEKSLETLRLLVVKGADAHTKDGTFGRALQATTLRGSKKVVLLLIRKGADVNGIGGRYYTALQAAAAAEIR